MRLFEKKVTESEAFTSGIYSSVADILPECITGEKLSKAALLNRDTYSFKVSYRFEGNGDRTVVPVYFRIEGDFPSEAINVYKIGNVPIINPVPNCVDKSHLLSDSPSLYPDPLYILSKNTVVEQDDCGRRWFEEGQRVQLNAGRAYQALWVELNPDSKQLVPGNYTLQCVFRSLTDNAELSREIISVSVKETSIKEQAVTCTNWFYCDSIADVYSVEVFSDRHFEIIESFIETAAKNGNNMILTPAFTPPLDTRFGKRRKTVQLVGVKRVGGKYEFDFSLFERFVGICLEKGIRYFEHSHFFTQWGAAHCPDIVAEVDGNLTHIFGWQCDAGSDEYTAFLEAYITALLPVLEKLGIKERIYFHISDEPGEKALENYRAARQTLKKIYPGIKTIDAMSSFKFCEQKIVDIPVVREISGDMKLFSKSGCDFWIYYTGGVIEDGNSNRLITLPQARNRMIGVHMYVAGASGFLHWGYNYYYDVLSHGVVNPLSEPCSYLLSPGTSFLVYPSLDGKAVPSQRLKVMRDGFGDYTALKMLEEKIGREEVLALINKTLGKEVFVDTMITGNELLRLKDTVLSML